MLLPWWACAASGPERSVLGSPCSARPIQSARAGAAGSVAEGSGISRPVAAPEHRVSARHAHTAPMPRMHGIPRTRSVRSAHRG